MRKSNKQRLTVSFIEQLSGRSETTFHSDERQPGLELVVTPKGTRMLYVRMFIQGKERRKALGSTRADSTVTFADAFHLWLNRHAKRQKKTWKEDLRKFNRYATLLHYRPLAGIDVELLEKLHDSITESHGGVPETKSGDPATIPFLSWTLSDNRRDAAFS